MDGAQFSAVGCIDVFNLILTEVIDASCIAEGIVLNQVYISIDVTLQGSIGVVVVFGVIGGTIEEVRSPRIGQVLLGMVLDGLELVASAGDDEAVYQSVVSLIVHSVSLYAGDVVPFGHVREKAVLVVGYALGVTFFAILVDIIYFWVAKESKSLSK